MEEKGEGVITYDAMTNKLTKRQKEFLLFKVFYLWSGQYVELEKTTLNNQKNFYAKPK